MSAGRRVLVAGTALALLAQVLAQVAAVRTATAVGEPAERSAFCHVSDGQFSTCPDGGAEWSDTVPAEFPERHAFLYSDQADLRPDRSGPQSPADTFMLLYDECGRTAPLRPDDYFLVSFDTVEHEDGEAEEIERYTVRVFSDATIVFLLNGEVQADASGRTRAEEIHGQRGRAGFGRSPRCDFDHLVVEYQVELDIAGGSGYSPDPLFWGGTPPNQPPVAGDDEADIADRQSAPVTVLGNDSDPDGSIDPSTVAVVSQPGHGTVRVGAGGVVTYDKGEDFEDTDEFSYTVRDDEGATSNTATVTVTGTCQTGRSVPVALPAVEGTKTVPSLAKGYSIGYAPLDLTFTTVTARSPAYCSLDSNVGVLRVLLTCIRPGSPCPIVFPPLVPIPMATSTAVASLDFFQASKASAPPMCDFRPLGQSNNCTLNSPAGASVLVRWHTPGFDMRDIVTGRFGRNTGPLTFWVNLNALVSPKASLAAKVQAAEVYIHTTLIDHLSSVDRWAIIQDPPADLLVTDPSGNTTGLTPAGETVTGIRGSVYSPAQDPAPSAVVIIEPEPGEYRTLVHGTEGAPFTLSMAVVDMFGDVGDPAVAEQTAEGTIVPGGTEFTFTVPAEHRPPLPRLATRPGFDATALPANDDGSSGPVDLGFTANFFGRAFTTAFVNNNGNLTFDAPLAAFTPFDLSSTERSIIAPFFADVDTRVGNVTRYGTGLVDGRPAFGVTWPGVGCFATITAVRNTFQVVLVDRGDVGAGDFDIEFNYDQIQWETGTASGGNAQCQGGSSARAGFAKGTGEPGTFFELAGSGVPGAFLDTNQATGLIHHGLGSPVPGRYVFAVRNGAPQTADADADGVRDELDNCPDTANADQRDANLDGIGEACSPPGRAHATAGFLQAGPDGRTAVTPTALGIADEPSMLDRLVPIVRFRLDAGLATSAPELTAHLVDSLVELGLVAAPDAAALEQAVLGQLNQPPDCRGVTVDRPSLWPPNHALERVTVSGGTDPDAGDGVTLAVDAVTQDELVAGPGHRHEPDATLTAPPSAAVSLRSERDGRGDGRVYRLHVTATDTHGATCTAEVTVGVAHDRERPAVDSAPPSFDSLRPAGGGSGPPGCRPHV